MDQASDSQNTTVAAGSRPRGRARRLFRLCRRSLLCAALLLAIALLIVTRTGVVGGIVADHLRSLLACDVTYGRSTISFSGRVIVEDLVLTTPHLDGPAGELLSARRVVIDLTWGDLFSGQVRPSGMRIYDPLVRVSQSTEDDSLNLLAIVGDGSSGSSGGSNGSSGSAFTGDSRPPRIDAMNAIIEVGEHGPDGYTRLNRLYVDGSLTPDDDRAPIYRVKLQQSGIPADLTMRPELRGMVLEGQLDLQAPSVELNLANLKLDEWRADKVPASVRELWRELDIRGKISQAEFTYDAERGVAVELVPENVAISLPIPAGRPEETDENLKLSGVEGSISLSNDGLTADLLGLVEGQTERSEVRFSTDGTSLDAALSCRVITRGFVVSKNPGLLRFAPAMVHRRFESFSGPTAVLDADIGITRGPATDDGPGEFSTTGSILVRNGQLAYEAFKYPVENLSGYVTFDDHQIQLIGVSGNGPTGAKLRAQGRFELPNEGSDVLLEITGVDVPVDDVMGAALRGRGIGAMDVLCDRVEYQRLIEQGLIVTDAEATELEAERDACRLRLVRAERDGTLDSTLRADLSRRLDEITRRLDGPRFTLGGNASIDVRIEHAEQTGWNTVVDVGFEQLNMVTGPFPFPVIARDVRVQVSGGELIEASGSVKGLAGGSATIGMADEPNTIIIEADGLPIDQLLVNAIPDGAALTDGSGGDPVIAQDLIESLGITGEIGCVAKIRSAAESREYDVEVMLDDLIMHPHTSADEAVTLDRVSGSILVSNDRLRLPSFSGRLVGTNEAGRTIPLGEVSMAFDIGLDAGAEAPIGIAPPPDEPVIDGWVRVDGFDASARVEGVIDLVAPEAAQTMRRLRTKHGPTGFLDAIVSYTRHRSSESRLSVVLERADGLRVDALGARCELDHSSGFLELVLDGDGQRLEGRGFETTLYADEARVADVAIDGSMVVIGDPDPDAKMLIRSREIAVEHPFVEAILRETVSDGAATTFTQHAPAGRADADVRVGDGRPLADGETPPVAVTIRPRALTLVRAGEKIELGDVEGSIEWSSGQGGTLRTLRGVSDNWTVDFDGGWQQVGDEIRIAGDLALDVQRMDPALGALLPKRVREAMEGIELDFDRPLFVTDGELSILVADGDVVGGGASGILRFAEASLDVGVVIEHAVGEVAFDVDSPRVGPMTLDLELAADALEIGGIEMTNARANIRSGEHSGNIACPYASADCHGGRAWAKGLYSKLTEQDDAPHGYEIDVRLDRVRFDDLIQDLSRDSSDPRILLAASSLDDDAPADPVTDQALAGGGLIDASLSLGGVVGDANSRAGRGAVRVVGRDVIQLPVLFAIVQLSTFQLPTADKLDYLQTQFHILGDRVSFDHVAVLAETLSLLGSGSMSWETKDIDMAFNSKSNRRIPVVSDLFEAVRDELLTTTVGGTVGDPVFGTRQLSGTTRLLGSVFGASDASPSTDLPDAERKARAERRRVQSFTAADPGP